MLKTLKNRLCKLEIVRLPAPQLGLLIVDYFETLEEVAEREGFDLSSDRPRLIIYHPDPVKAEAQEQAARAKYGFG